MKGEKFLVIAAIVILILAISITRTPTGSSILWGAIEYCGQGEVCVE